MSSRERRPWGSSPGAVTQPEGEPWGSSGAGRGMSALCGSEGGLCSRGSEWTDAGLQVLSCRIKKFSLYPKGYQQLLKGF